LISDNKNYFLGTRRNAGHQLQDSPRKSYARVVQKTKNRQAVSTGGFSGYLGANLAQSLRQRLGKAIKVKPESVGAVHFRYLQDGFKHDFGQVGKVYLPRWR
jgi:hypothetical protein